MSGLISRCDEGPECPYYFSRVEHVWISGGTECHRSQDHYVAAESGEFSVEAFVLYDKIFCTEACALEWREGSLSDRDPPVCRGCNEHPPAYAGACLDCVNEEREARYLPLAALCVVCVAMFIPINGEGTCSDPCTQEARRELSHRRRAREVGAFVADVNRAEVFKRDDYICQLCHSPIDMSLTFPHRLSPSIDHIIPLAVGGTHEPDNVQASHFGCNAAKGARVPSASRSSE